MITTRQKTAFLLAAAIGLSLTLPGDAMPGIDSDERDPLVIRAEHLRFVRSLRVVWVEIEAGAPGFFFGPPASDEQHMLARLREVYGKRNASRDELVAFYREGMRAAEAFVSNAVLGEGRYHYRNSLRPKFLARQPFVVEKLCALNGDDVTVDITADHLALLKHLNLSLFGEGGLDMNVVVDPKRPYGDMTYFYLDMADALRLEPEGPPREDDRSLREFTDTQTRRLDRLHFEMQPVLQVLLLKGQLAATRFHRVPAGYGCWSPL